MIGIKIQIRDSCAVPLKLEQIFPLLTSKSRREEPLTHIPRIPVRILMLEVQNTPSLGAALRDSIPSIEKWRTERAFPLVA
jgi:hypothetical protein